MSNALTHNINNVMFHEMGDLGPMIVKKKCKDAGLSIDNIKTEDLPVVSKVVAEAMMNFGPDVSKRVYNKLNKLRSMEGIIDAEMDMGKRVDGYFILGDAARLSGEQEKAIEFYNKVLAMRDVPEAKRQSSRANCMIGICLNLMNEPKKAMEYLRCAMKDGEESMTDDLKALFHRGIGYSYWRQGNFNETQRQYDEALKWAFKSGIKKIIGMIKIDIGMLLENMCKYNESLASYWEAIDALAGSDDYYNMARAYNNSGEIYKHYNQFRKAIECYNRCYEISKAGRNEVMMGYALVNSAECYAKMGELNKARENAAKTIEISQKRNDLYMMAAAHLTYGIIFSKEGDKARMDKHFTEAIRELRTLDYPYEIGTHTFEYAKALREQGYKNEARNRFNEAKEIFIKIGSTKFVQAIEDELKALQAKVLF